MDSHPIQATFDNASQRVASTYLRMLREFSPVTVTALGEAEQRDLHAFFEALYAALYSVPEIFGLPPAKDIYTVADHAKEGPGKSEVKRVLDKQRKAVEEGLSLLAAAGKDGQIAGDTLLLAPGSAAVEALQKKPGRAWARGMERAGLVLAEIDGMITASNPRFPRMMPALQALAQSCAGCPNPDVGRVFFARCDFRALQGDFRVGALELYRIFPAEDDAWAAAMHEYFTTHGYQAQVEIGRMFSWVVKYQGKRSIKGTPLFQIDFDERSLRQMRAAIKCASAQRIAPLLPHQSQALQADFFRRANRCGGCSWCATRPHLGPAEIEYQGETRKVCWYVNPDLQAFSPETQELVKEYALMHEHLG